MKLLIEKFVDKSELDIPLDSPNFDYIQYSIRVTPLVTRTVINGIPDIQIELELRSVEIRKTWRKILGTRPEPTTNLTDTKQQVRELNQFTEVGGVRLSTEPTLLPNYNRLCISVIITVC